MGVSSRAKPTLEEYEPLSITMVARSSIMDGSEMMIVEYHAFIEILSIGPAIGRVVPASKKEERRRNLKQYIRTEQSRPN
jgi:hypothetical protein